MGFTETSRSREGAADYKNKDSLETEINKVKQEISKLESNIESQRNRGLDMEAKRIQSQFFDSKAPDARQKEVAASQDMASYAQAGEVSAMSVKQMQAELGRLKLEVLPDLEKKLTEAK